MALFFGDIIDVIGRNVNNGDSVGVVSEVCLKFVYLGLGTLVAAFLQVACWVITGERQAARIRNLYLKTVLRQDIGFFDVETSTGEVIARMSGDTVLILDAMAFVKGWLLTLVMLTSIPLLAVAGAAMSIMFAKASSQEQAAYAKASTVVEQTFGSIRTVASFTGEKQATSSYKELINMSYKSSVKQGFSTGLGFGVMFLVFFFCYALSIWSLGQTASCLTAFAAGQAAAYKIFETIKRNPLIDSLDLNGKVFLEDIRGKIELEDVWFSYPARPKEEIFGGFSLLIPSGASALEFQLKWIRGKIGLVSQEPVLSSSSIMENIRYGNDSATVEEVKTAAKLANAANFIDKLPRGLETMVGQHGTQLSGGQTQRIAIARAIIKDPRILLLDEATSALDAESERTVQEALDRVMVNRTTLIVAHRLRNADMIAVIHRGKIVEEGSHSELLKDHEGAYSQLIRLQRDKQRAETIGDF
ncbi:unnamed protein product [Arabis nemorensis]|uniref:ABC transmembrane type-1 domain-containing protein n=1 Tax=Arabis nemorensis TaxID=586526 RepID=A0A565C284_9BRAS|nr:unnamed protein product [Arabis nemorensis]